MLNIRRGGMGNLAILAATIAILATIPGIALNVLATIFTTIGTTPIATAQTDLCK